MSDTAGRRGSVRRAPARGTWTVVVDASDFGAVTRRQVRRRGFRTERDAQRALTEVLAELDHGTYVAPDLTTTLADYVEGTWTAGAARPPPPALDAGELPTQPGDPRAAAARSPAAVQGADCGPGPALRRPAGRR